MSVHDDSGEPRQGNQESGYSGEEAESHGSASSVHISSRNLYRL